MTEIATPRLRLRPARQEDLEPLHDILADPAAMAYWSTLPHTSLDETRDFLAAMIAIPPEEGEDFIIERQGRAIGKAGFFRFPEIGYILHPSYWGDGIAMEALRPVLARAFAIHRLEAVFADVDPRNIASLSLLTRLGFRETGRKSRTWRIGEAWSDSVYLRLDNPQSAAPDGP